MRLLYSIFTARTRSFVDQDTDRYVFEVNAIHLRRKMESLEDSVQWTDLVAMMCREGHAEGITREQIENALKILPVVSNLKLALFKTSSRAISIQP